MVNKVKNATIPVVAMLGALCAINLASCSTAFNEKYHVGVYDLGGKDGKEVGPTQFYRFRLKGASSFGSNTRYEAGWYDAAVVDRLFGEIKDKRVIKAGNKKDHRQPVYTISVRGGRSKIG